MPAGEMTSAWNKPVGFVEGWHLDRLSPREFVDGQSALFRELNDWRRKGRTIYNIFFLDRMARFRVCI